MTVEDKKKIRVVVHIQTDKERRYLDELAKERGVIDAGEVRVNEAPFYPPLSATLNSDKISSNNK